MQEAVRHTLNVIFEDPGVEQLLVKLYQKGKSLLKSFTSFLFLDCKYYKSSPYICLKLLGKIDQVF